MKVSKLDRLTQLTPEVVDQTPWFYWEKSNEDEIDGAHVGGMTFRRDPVTGLLCGVLDEPKKKEGEK